MGFDFKSILSWGVLILKVFFRGLYGRLKECIQLLLYTLVMYFGG